MKTLATLTGLLFIFWVGLCIVLALALSGCNSLDRFKPIITAAGHELLLELDELLTEYEQSALPIDATVDETLAFAQKGAALRAKITNRLYHASLEAPADVVRPYRKRLRAATSQEP